MKKRNVVPFKKDAEIYFRAGLRFAEKRMFEKSLKYLQKAVDISPFNADYQFNLATVLAEMKDIEKSNKILLDILKDIDPTLTECYFGIGCNYFDLGNLKKAREYFEKYIYYDPDGQFAEDAYDILYYMKIYDGLNINRRKPKAVEKLIREGRALLEALKFEKAYIKLEAAVEIDPEAVEPRKDLAIICLLTGRTDKAISITKSILLLQPENLFAHFNLAMLYAHAEEAASFNRQIDVLTGLHSGIKDELDKLLDIYQRLCKGSCSVKYTDIQSIIERISKKLEHRAIRWKKEWEDIIQCALKNKEFIYRVGYEKELKSIWMNYIKKVYPVKVPVIRKREVWAAALEYIYCNLHLIRVSKNSLARKYNISVSSITNRLKDFSV